MRYISKIIFVHFLIAFSVASYGQSGRSAPILRWPSRPLLSCDKACVWLKLEEGMYIYSNPTSLFTQKETSFSIGYGGTLYNEKWAIILDTSKRGRELEVS